MILGGWGVEEDLGRVGEGNQNKNIICENIFFQ